MSARHPDDRPPLPRPMLTGDTAPLDLVTIRATVRRALQERPVRPCTAEIAELTRTLRAHLGAMLDEAHHRAALLTAGTPARLRWETLIAHVRADLAFGLGQGQPVRAAADAYVRILARDARFLADRLDE
ncbi:hypothetical protein I5Q34_13380 [Streptomyces sp. AV19]|uniref:DUF6415 family natural product biosynthesis protein n=1 Tax=Streptomyces sp. AV19 TaxID=2793068 RepID=UPI0018FE8FCD|nr:DUF6415 family natural product biosynthesis protein [Streptomyces sp. AV19]MBH1935253.1 hypothetical protein [Streptomyces sp. AV19]MDG4532069.1 DUF6415 family natural product biosynthesis protein [Streptomyces sp. AV19]